MTFFEKIKREQGAEFFAIMLAEAYAKGVAHTMIASGKQDAGKVTKHDDAEAQKHVERFMTSSTGGKVVQSYFDWLNAPVKPYKKE